LRICVEKLKNRAVVEEFTTALKTAPTNACDAVDNINRDV